MARNAGYIHCSSAAQEGKSFAMAGLEDLRCESGESRRLIRRSGPFSC
jgi:hypothetical protein